MPSSCLPPASLLPSPWSRIHFASSRGDEKPTNEIGINESKNSPKKHPKWEFLPPSASLSSPSPLPSPSHVPPISQLPPNCLPPAFLCSIQSSGESEREAHSAAEMERKSMNHQSGNTRTFRTRSASDPHPIRMDPHGSASDPHPIRTRSASDLSGLTEKPLMQSLRTRTSNAISLRFIRRCISFESRRARSVLYRVLYGVLYGALNGTDGARGESNRTKPKETAAIRETSKFAESLKVETNASERRVRSKRRSAAGRGEETVCRRSGRGDDLPPVAGFVLSLFTK